MLLLFLSCINSSMRFVSGADKDVVKKGAALYEKVPIDALIVLNRTGISDLLDEEELYWPVEIVEKI